MRTSCRLAVVHLALSMVLAATARAELILDTGEGTNPPPAGSSLSDEQGLGVKLTLTQTYQITSIQAWLWKSGIGKAAGDITLAIYGDAGQTPDTNVLHFSTVFFADGPGSTEATWIGPDDLNWTLGPGSYWITFRVIPPSTARFVAPNTSATPQSQYATYWTDLGQWLRQESDRWGIRVQGVPLGPPPENPTDDGDDDVGGDDDTAGDDSGDDTGEDGDDDSAGGSSNPPRFAPCGAIGNVTLTATGLFLWLAGRRRAGMRTLQ